MIDRKAFKAFIPNSKYADQWHDTLFGAQTELDGRSLLEDYEINTPKRMAAFLAQTHHESGGYVWLTENLNYNAEGLLRVFPKYFPSMDIAKAYARQPDKIANRTYANRMGNGLPHRWKLRRKKLRNIRNRSKVRRKVRAGIGVKID